MEKGSFFELQEETRDVDLEVETLAFCAETVKVLFSIGSSARNLEKDIDSLEERVGKERFQEIMKSVSEGEKRIISSSCNNVEKIMQRVRELMELDEEE